MIRSDLVTILKENRTQYSKITIRKALRCDYGGTWVLESKGLKKIENLILRTAV